MPQHSSRALSGLVPCWLRSLTVSSFALGGLLAAAPAHAADPQEVRPNIATVLDVALMDGELTASILWTDRQEDLPRSAKLVSHDGKDTANAGVNVTPKPGEISQVKVFGALDKPWETGWAQKLVLEDPRGQPLATQPYDVNLDCATDKECSLTVSKDFPHLRGEAMVYVQQWYWWYLITGPCTCGWTTTTTRTPTTPQSILVSASGRGIYSWNGPGAKHTLSANAIPTGPLLNRTVAGASQLSLGLRCSRRIYFYWWDFVIYRPGGGFPVRFPFPVSIPCTSPCQARFDHTGRVTGRTSISGVATAREAGTWRVNGGSPYINQLITGNNAFDADAIAVSFSNTSAYNTVSTSGQVTIPSTSTFASALVTNGYAQAIHGQLTCPQIPALAGRTVSDYGTTQGTPHQLSLFWFLQDFAAGF